MSAKQNKIHLSILGATALFLSRLLFWFFDDPEGPNLLVVGIGALVLYLFAVLVYFLKLHLTKNQRVGLAIIFQVAALLALKLLLA